MAKAIAVHPDDWKLAIRIKTTQDLFNFLSRTFATKAAIPAQKVHVVEFFAKP